MAERPTAHTFEQVNWENAEEETRIGVLQEMVAILLNRLDEYVAAPAVTVERLTDGIAYALARAALPEGMETSRDYAIRLAPLVIESGFLARLSESVPEGEPRE